ncbi:MAG: glutamyl-tRNA reductase [Betaproteobacteria bacterium]|nr:glutamyl-tRNA reductase [Betaproteobacteria bacterium]
MPLYAIGLNHRTAPIEIRERVAFPLETQRPALDALKRHTAADEIAMVSTCNRTEIYLRATNVEAAEKAASWLSTQPSTHGTDLQPHLYQLAEADVARHAFRVASGLDSMILGEPQILGQVKLAVKVADEAGMLGGPLDRLFQETFKVAKQVRTDTEIGATSVSMAAASLKLAQQLFGDLRDTRLLLIGVGEMIELAATHFAAQTPKSIVVANRTLERGRELAARFNASAITLQQLPERIHEFDIVISSTASTLPIIGKGMIESALRIRRHRPMFMVDLAVPRDIEAEVGDLDDVFLYTLDALGKVIQQNTERREAAVQEADAIIERRTVEYMQWLGSRASVPVIQQLRGKADHYRQIELDRAAKMLARGDDPVKVMEQLAHGLTNKFLHHPLAALNRSTGSEREALAAALAKLYPDQEEP